MTNLSVSNPINNSVVVLRIIKCSVLITRIFVAIFHNAVKRSINIESHIDKGNKVA